MISYSYKLFQYDNMYNLLTTICIIMITISNSLVITTSYSYCITYIRLSIVRRIILRLDSCIILRRFSVLSSCLSIYQAQKIIALRAYYSVISCIPIMTQQNSGSFWYASIRDGDKFGLV